MSRLLQYWKLGIKTFFFKVEGLNHDMGQVTSSINGTSPLPDIPLGLGHYALSLTTITS